MSERPPEEIAIGAARSVRGGYPRRLRGDAATAGGYSGRRRAGAAWLGGFPALPSRRARRAESGEDKRAARAARRKGKKIERGGWKPRLGWWKVREEASRRLPAAQRERERERITAASPED